MEYEVFRIDVVDNGRELTLALRGELDLATVAEVEAVIARCGVGREALTVDLSGLTFMDSTGLRLILALGRREDGLRIDFVAPSAQVGRVIDLSGVRDAVDWVDGSSSP